MSFEISLLIKGDTIRVKAVIAYDGSKFFGFQQQKETNKTVTTMIEKALKKLNIDSTIIGSGRTDAGVHATGQIISFDIPIYWSSLKKLKISLNRLLQNIYFKHISKVNDDFHPRFDAKKRVYRYIFKTTTPSIFEDSFVSYYSDFDEVKLQDALKVFEGEHNFGNFLKTGSVTNNNIRIIYKSYYRYKKGYHYIYFEANGFLRAQVRMMIEFAMRCATNNLSIEQLKSQLDLVKKTSSSLASPQGLYLARVIY
jgi:tRNA pseudouridine38-40 synthase